MLRSPLYSVIKITGFALGLACTLLLLVYVGNELSYDKFHKNSERIYRVLIHADEPEGESISAVQTAAIAPTLQAEIPDIESSVRLANPFSGLITYNEHSVKTSSIYYADSSFFSVFSFKLIEGNPATALANPYSILISETTAQKVFGDEDPLGKTIILNREKQFKVTGIVEDAPSNSQIRYSALASFSSLYNQGLFLDWNGGWNYFSYFLVNPHTNPEDIEIKSKPIFDREINNMLKDIGVSYSLMLEPLTKAHLFSKAEFDLPTKGSPDQILILTFAGLMVLIMACVNFVTLSTVQATSRLKEIGVRKVIGAHTKGLFIRFMAETVLITFLSLLIAGVVLVFFDPWIEEYMGTSVSGLFLANPWMLVILLFLILAIGFISGAYPAFVLSRFKTAEAVKGRFNSRKDIPKAVSFLILFQFIVTITLFILTEVVYQQRAFISKKNLGFMKENLVVLPLSNQDIRDNFNLLKNEINKFPETISIGGSSEVPGNGFTSNGYFPEGHKDPMMIHALDIDPDYLKTMGIKIIQGRNFSEDLASDKDSYLINQTLAKRLGWEDPEGHFITRGGNHPVIGVVQDFNYNTLHHPIEPLIITMKPWNGYQYLSIRIRGNNIPQSMEDIRTAWNKINPPDSFEPYFLDQSFAAYYQNEKKLGEVFFIFAFIALSLCATGMLGTVSFSMKGKVKEIGIRKVMGSDTSTLVARLTKKFFLWILIANAIAVPLAFYLSGQWLERFEYNPGLSPWLFAAGIVFSLLLGSLTSGILAFKAASANPVESLHQE